MPQVGLEPTRLSAMASKTIVAAITPPGQTYINFGGTGRDRTDTLLDSLRILSPPWLPITPQSLGEVSDLL